MKTIYRITLAVILATTFAIGASAQFRAGIRLGLNVNKLSISSDMASSDNRAGFNGGVTAEFMFPGTGFGVDGSIMYVHRTDNYVNYDDGTSKRVNKNCDYIEVPLNVKWKLSLPAVSNFIAPYVFTGPSFSFLTSKRAVSNSAKRSTYDVAWNFGFGLQLIKKLQLSASYGLGFTKAYKLLDSDAHAANIEGKNRYWTVTAAWLF